MKVIIVRFIIPFLLILIIGGFILFNKAVNNAIIRDAFHKDDVQNDSLLAYYMTLSEHPKAWMAMKQILSDKNGVLVMGSSELTTDDPNHAKPYFFIPENTPYHIIAVGHAGNQAFSIFAQLLTLHKYINHANVVIILSPIWYLGNNAKGTTLDIFLEFVPRFALNRILLDKEIPSNFKQYFYKYISQKYPELISPSPELKLMNYYYHAQRNFVSNIAYTPLILLNKLILNYANSINNVDLLDIPSSKKEFFVYNCSSKVKSNISHIRWDSLYIKSVERHKCSSLTNSWGINDEYYKNYVHGEHGLVKVVPMNKNLELQDLRQLVDLLIYYKVNALFVMQAANPFYYEQLNKFRPIDDSIKIIIGRSGFHYYNMLEYDTARYQKALMTDVMHMSEYGWLTVDKFILDKQLNYEEGN
ncbi:MAG: hypothetical protein NTU44_14525 [Bacteroidetes bacterium]|nr:hypothetical protein [Bacteroidota bacterium]